LLRGHYELEGRSNLGADRGVLRGKIELRNGLMQGGDLRLRDHGFVASLVYVNCNLAPARLDCEWLEWGAAGKKERPGLADRVAVNSRRALQK
jgi:hypothetical protein